MTLTVRAITPGLHSAWIADQPSVSFLQTPEWGKVKTGWRSESIGWFDGSRLVGAGLVLYRPVPRLEFRSLAYLPEGPAIDWLRREHQHLALDDWLKPMLRHCRAQGAFQVKMGPPVALRQWDAETIKTAIAERQEDAGPAAGAAPARLSEVLADRHFASAIALVERLQSAGWTQEPSRGAGFGDVQPRYVFQLPLAGRSLDDVFTGFNQLWRRNVRKAEKVGVTVVRGDRGDLADFHAVYVETAARDGFTARALGYFEQMWDSLNSRTERLQLHIAHYDGHVAAAALMVVVGTHAWYSYGASTTADRDVRPSNALQWNMIQAAHDAGCDVYDLRGIADTVDPSDHLFGLVQFKLGTGGFAQEYAGEWDYALRPLWSRAFRTIQARRG